MKSLTCWLALSLILCVSRGLAGDPHKAQRDYDLGIHFEQAGQLPQAIEAFTQSIAAEPSARAYAHRAKSLLALKFAAKAESDLEAALALEPENAEAWRWRGDADAALGNERKAIEDYTHAIDLGTATSPVYTARAALHEKLGFYQLAIDD